MAEVVTAPIGEDDIGIQASWSGVSIGTEFAVLTGKLDWGAFPIVTGYMATGEVVAAGANVKDFAVGDTVYYRRTPHCSSASRERPSTAVPAHTHR